MISTKTIVITGTHHTPAIELIKLLQQDTKTNWKIHYIGHLYEKDTHITHTIIPKLKIPFYNLDSGKYDRKNLIPTILNIPKIILSFFKSIKLIYNIKPNIVVSFGGYVSVPVIIASRLFNIPSITHEQTLTESLSTKINSYFVDKVATSFPSNNKKSFNTGNLIRSDIFNQKSRLFTNIKKPIIYITGGNQGSEFLNDLTIKIAPKLKKYSIIHQTGKKQVFNLNISNYHHYEYIEIEDIGWVLNNSQIIISRSGANICQEIDVLNKNAILIPLIFTQQDEQVKNAIWLKNKHPQNVIVIPQAEATPEKVLESINKLPNDNKITKPKIVSSHPLLDLIYQLV